jgi:hypothetical protein
LSVIELCCLSNQVYRRLHIPDAGQLNGDTFPSLFLDDRLGNAEGIYSPADNVDNAVKGLFFSLVSDLGEIGFIDKVNAAAEIQAEPHAQRVVARRAFTDAGRSPDEYLAQSEAQQNYDDP